MRISIAKEDEKLIERFNTLYQFKNYGLILRIAFSQSLLSGKLFNDIQKIEVRSGGKEFRDDFAIFGNLIGNRPNTIIFKVVLDQHYNKNLSEQEFITLFRSHVSHGLEIWENKLGNTDIAFGGHIDLILKSVEKGLSLRRNIVPISTPTPTQIHKISEFKDPLNFSLGQTENGDSVTIKINDLREFDNRNIAIAGMSGSGKTQLIKDILYQISKSTDCDLKFIFFDYKGEGDRKNLDYFLSTTKCKFVDIVEDGGIEFNPFSSISSDHRQRPFNIKALVDTIGTFHPKIGVAQKNILTNIIVELYENRKNGHPSILELFDGINDYYELNGIKPDTLFAAIQDLSRNIFKDSSDSNITEQSVYLNLPPALSDTLRQLIVFLLLRYFNFFFSSTNDCKPKNYIVPLRYVIVIDEAHVYLKNKNARKALEDLLRLLRSKGVITVLLSQGVEDYKTRDFDFASQVKLPICLNIQNKEYRSISNFVGTPSSKYKLEREILKLDSGKGLINIDEPKIIELRQWWKTKKELDG